MDQGNGLVCRHQYSRGMPFGPVGTDWSILVIEGGVYQQSVLLIDKSFVSDGGSYEL